MTAHPTDSFVPLTSAPSPTGERQEFRVLLAQHPDRARPFGAGPTAASQSSGTPPFRQACEPRVSVQRDGERVCGIQVQCSCGQVVELVCAYKDELAAKGSA